jgi:hypothetical protein
MSGTTDVPKWFSPDTAEDARHDRLLTRYVDTALAGAIAEGIHRGVDDQIAGDSCAGHRAAAIDLAAYLCGSSEIIEKYLDYRVAVVKARLSSRPNWAAVSAVAEALIVQRTITARNTRRIIRAVFGEAGRRDVLGVAPLELLGETPRPAKAAQGKGRR